MSPQLRHQRGIVERYRRFLLLRQQIAQIGVGVQFREDRGRDALLRDRLVHIVGLLAPLLIGEALRPRLPRREVPDAEDL